MQKSSSVYWVTFFSLFVCIIFTKTVSADFTSSETLLTETENVPYYLKDRGEGAPTSMFGTYIKKGQMFIYPFFEYYYDNDLEYSPEVSSRWRLYGGIEGSQDEVELITEAQLHLNRNMFFKFNSAFGATSKATGWAPEIGIVFSF